jgi:hypothetical protein
MMECSGTPELVRRLEQLYASPAGSKTVDVRRDPATPDLDDPYGPAGRDPGEKLMCLHCDRRFTVADVKWEPGNGGIWVCPSWPSCDGGGIGFDLVRVDPEH